MTDRVPQIQSIRIDKVSILNPRVRNKRIFQELVTSIAHLGLKRPITVSAREGTDQYDLVCGQGRLEAFLQLGQTHIPAVIVQATRQECFVMSLVENLARRNHTPLELVREIGALRDRGYSLVEISVKTDFSEEYVYAICYLLDHGEERLLAGVEKGIIPASIAMQIARAKDTDVQKALAEAYEQKTIPGNQVLAIRKIVEQRNLSGKTVAGAPYRSDAPRTPVTATALVRAYQKETERQKMMVKKATLAQSRLLFLVNALKRLIDDDHFTTLLRAESIKDMPRPLAERLTNGGVL